MLEYRATDRELVVSLLEALGRAYLGVTRMGMDHREGRPNSVKIVPSAVRDSDPMQDLRLAVTAIIFGAGVDDRVAIGVGSTDIAAAGPTRVRSGNSRGAFGHRVTPDMA